MQVTLGWTEYRPKWGDGQVVLSLKPLTNAALLALMPYFESTDAEDGKTAIGRILHIQEAAAPILPGFCRVLAGLQDETGNLVTVEQIAAEAPLMELCVEVIGELVTRSRLGRVDQGN